MEPLVVTDNSADELERRFGETDLETLDDHQKSIILAIRSAIDFSRNHLDADYEDIVTRANRLMNPRFRAALSIQCGSTHFFKGAEAPVVIVEEGFAKTFENDRFSDNPKRRRSAMFFLLRLK